MDIVTVFEWFAEESKSIAEQATEPAQREKFVKLASLWANAMLESTSATSLPRRDSRRPPARFDSRGSESLLALLVGAVFRVGRRAARSLPERRPARFRRAAFSFGPRSPTRAQSPNRKARRDSAQPVGAFHNSDALNLAKRRLCDAVGVSLGSAAHC